MNILVTGANGQLGREIQKVVKMIGNGRKNHYVGEKNYYIFTDHAALDITDEKAVENFVKENFISVIINCAAYTNVDNAQNDQDKAYAVNALGPLNLALAAAKVGAVLIHISTDYVFGGEYNTPLPPLSQNEEPYFTPADRDKNFYGYSKLVAEDLIEKSGCKYLIFRTSWLYSAEGKNFVKTMYEKSLQGVPVKVVYDQVGSPTSAKDLAVFLTKIIEYNSADTRYLSKTGIYNYANKGVASWYDVAHCIFSVNNKSAYVTPCRSSEWPTPVKRPAYSVLDVSKTEEVFSEDIEDWRTALVTILSELSNARCDATVNFAYDNDEYDYGHNVSNKGNEE